MFCRKCGANVPDGVKFCSVCGQLMEEAAPAAPVAPEAPAAPVYAEPVYAAPVAPAPKKNMKGILIAAVAAVLALVLCLVLFSGGGAEAAMEDYLNAYYNGDLSGVEDMLPEAVWTQAAKMGVTPEAIEALGAKQMAEIAEDYEEFKAESFNVNILAVEDVSEKELAELKATFALTSTPCEVTDARYVHYEVLGESLTGEELVVTCSSRLVVEVDGDWYVARSSGSFAASEFISLVKK